MAVTTGLDDTDLIGTRVDLDEAFATRERSTSLFAHPIPAPVDFVQSQNARKRAQFSLSCKFYYSTRYPTYRHPATPSAFFT
jgi:hypothetical protein